MMTKVRGVGSSSKLSRDCEGELKESERRSTRNPELESCDCNVYCLRVRIDEHDIY